MTKDVFCRDKHVFVATKIILVAAPAKYMPQVSEKHVFCRDKSMLAGTNVLSR